MNLSLSSAHKVSIYSSQNFLLNQASHTVFNWVSVRLDQALSDIAIVVRRSTIIQSSSLLGIRFLLEIWNERISNMTFGQSVGNVHMTRDDPWGFWRSESATANTNFEHSRAHFIFYDIVLRCSVRRLVASTTVLLCYGYHVPRKLTLCQNDQTLSS